MPAYREGKAFVKAIEGSVDRSQDRCRIRDWQRVKVMVLGTMVIRPR